MQPWNDTNRYSQTGYSSPTIWPMSENYTNNQTWAFDYAAALRREQSRQEWLEEENFDYRIEARIQAEETKALREEHYYD